MAVNWSKDVDQAFVEAKKKTDPFCATSAQRRSLANPKHYAGHGALSQ
jgi:hypothetical protein